MKSKKYLYILAILVVLIGSFYVFQSKLGGNSGTETKPAIVDFFACGDYCPEPREQYMVKVYAGITDPVECQKIGGRLSSFVGWETTYYCAVE